MSKAENLLKIKARNLLFCPPKAENILKNKPLIDIHKMS